jgi:hypothetical protein
VTPANRRADTITSKLTSQAGTQRNAAIRIQDTTHHHE